ncbi:MULTISPECIES: hypothetical protein [Legionella]|uniref:Secreted protein n=1 Tax=Legionella resiliens TaxID=2905958 RepID=A0ABS8X6W9_9GAMM|nr:MULTISPECIES: hypothetical protein [unclassified Legionella]MCE0724374.1 hypothetical protein [Legionella sp. 9fVS26]MCE3533526.1 hypothetical protein [Legionella sp. 8cVS16]QLZ69714.1 hypothetical protein FOLKNPGA_02512 [Legionella sp. PC1000]
MLKTLIVASGAVVLSLWAEISVAENIVCKDYNGNSMTLKPKTITIYNNSENTTIYPVLATSKNEVNEWIQGCFRTTEPYPTKYVYKLYVNEGTGIAPGSSVTITLPLYSELAKDRYITWWNGGRVVLADKNDRLRNEKDESLATPAGVTCQGQNAECKLSTYSSDVQFPENIYAQLSEYTFGDSIIQPKQSVRILKPENVGYNISYVDHVYMPVAIGPKNNPYIGYSGSAQSLTAFRDHLDSFLKTTLGQGWPVYNLNELKLPGGYNIFAQRTGTLPPEDNVPVKPKDGFPPVLTVLSCIQGKCSEEQKKSLHYGESVQRMQNLWGSCVNWDEDVSKYVTQKIDCPQDLKEKLGALQQFFKQNHQQYLQMYADKKCHLTPDVEPVPFNYWEALKHIYGWVPFNEGCGAGVNPLADTKIPGWNHAQIQSMYIHDLQYNYKTNITSELLFNPYVQLIHDKDYLSMDAYGFSVDDAVGFMSELGDGLIFTVGGTKGLENEQQFNYADGFSVAIGVPQSMVDQVNKPLLKKYGVCVFNQDAEDLNCQQVKQNVMMPDNSQIAGFRVGTVASYPIKVRFTDLKDNVYTFVVNTQFAPCPDGMESSQCPTNKAEIVNKQSCSVTKSDGEKHPKSNEWCQNANPNQQKEKQLTKNYLSFPQPVDLMK